MINYSIGEAQEVLNQGQIKDPYHRELFQWLIDQLRAVEEKEEPAATQQELIDALNMACGVTDEMRGLGSEVKTATQQAVLETQALASINARVNAAVLGVPETATLRCKWCGRAWDVTKNICDCNAGVCSRQRGAH